MLDYDNDGYLDIYVSNYGRWNYPEDHHRVGDLEKKIWLYSSPRTIKTVKHLFYRNNGNLTFTDVYDKVITVEKDEVSARRRRSTRRPSRRRRWTSRRKRVPNPRSDGHGFGVVTADLNDDGLIDIYVANDMNPNFLFLNRGDGTFDDVSEVSGAAFDINGMAQSGMGVDAEDVDGDGFPSCSSPTSPTSTTRSTELRQGRLLRQHRLLRPGLRHDAVRQVGHCARRLRQRRLARHLRRPTATSTTTAASSASRSTTRRSRSCSATWKGKRFRLSTRDVGPVLRHKHVGRGAAFGDLDNDGDIDIVVNEKDRHAAVLRNDTPTKNHWIRLALQGTKSNRDAIGTRVEVNTSASAHDLPPAEGGREPGVDQRPAAPDRGRRTSRSCTKITIRWPSGIVTTLEKRQGRPGLQGRRAQGLAPQAGSRLRAEAAEQAAPRQASRPIGE